MHMCAIYFVADATHCLEAPLEMMRHPTSMGIQCKYMATKLINPPITATNAIIGKLID